MKIQNVSDAAFKKYGKVITGLDCSDIIAAMAETPCPENVVYVPGAEPLESCASAKDIAYTLYGGMPVQIGYCNGNNHKLNGLEYHRDSEVNIAVTDLILLIGSEQDIENGKYDTSKVEAFLVPAGTVIEVYATTLHYSPCHADPAKGFRVMVALPAGTNTDFRLPGAPNPLDRQLWARNKWLIAHPDSAPAAKGAVIGLTGENIDISGDL